ncbi:putative membrane-associated protein [Desulfitobacterium dichloroeliminans LMG P-21439]|uniref:Putative membrane-associated protein n=1 Tax=Desulfitobacterium dichloroeliminans (strain LMG P-21439 / DCA1) TaxID=871963 RepID=L0F661_DESDL|nr:DedA family protein [Desulfitobacterium dichloroeliminans]AGA68448.1 putative membrane-associated protein [Desulfitobacterium dichloroeliminans LMG P-21439]
MEFLQTVIDIFIHLDKHLGEIISAYGLWTYLILFLIIFAETGLVVTPFLPGDSLLFVAGTFAAAGALDIKILFFLLLGAAVLGDTVNYEIGRYLGPKVFSKEIRFLNHENLLKTQKFYQKHGGKTIIIARFLPIIRTFAPFVAGVGAMKYMRFLSYNLIGALLWVTVALFGGFFFGNLPFVRDNFTLVIFAIIGTSAIPPVYAYLKSWLQKRAQERIGANNE